VLTSIFWLGAWEKCVHKPVRVYVLHSEFLFVWQTRAFRRSLPCQAEEEAHQLSFIEKHLDSILSLLAEPTDDGDDGGKVRGKFVNFEVPVHVKGSLPIFHKLEEKTGWAFLPMSTGSDRIAVMLD
jgi:hypothetical protein